MFICFPHGCNRLSELVTVILVSGMNKLNMGQHLYTLNGLRIEGVVCCAKTNFRFFWLVLFWGIKHSKVQWLPLRNDFLHPFSLWTFSSVYFLHAVSASWNLWTCCYLQWELTTSATVHWAGKTVNILK